jgi:Cu(I)/Ag(I) efflux system membrane fusion protein
VESGTRITSVRASPSFSLSPSAGSGNLFLNAPGLTTARQRLQIKPVKPVISRLKAVQWRATHRGRSPPLRGRGWVIRRLLVPFLAAVAGALGCGGADAPGKPAGVDYYTCGMHPSMRSQTPGGKCPICGMELVAVSKQMGASSSAAAGSAAENESAPGEFAVPLLRQQQIGVSYASVAKRPLIQSIRVPGKVAYDKQRHWQLVARVEGYIQKLQISSPGEFVQKNKPLMVIDSPALLIAQEELLDLLRLRDGPKAGGPSAAPAGGQKHGSTQSRQPQSESSLPGVAVGDENALESARRRLMLWGFSRNQLAELEQSRVARDTFTVFSPSQGVVQDLPVEQGQMVNMGDRLVNIVDLSAVWVWAEFYEDQLALLEKGLPATITSPSLPGESFEGKISVVDPFINDALRTVRVRIEVANPDFKLRPNMYVNAQLTLSTCEGLAVPVAAVLATGRHNIVFVAKGQDRLEPRFIELGGKYGEFYEVKSGLKETERVVTSANFLIDAEAKVQGALKSW